MTLSGEEDVELLLLSINFQAKKVNRIVQFASWQKERTKQRKTTTTTYTHKQLDTKIIARAKSDFSVYG